MHKKLLLTFITALSFALPCSAQEAHVLRWIDLLLFEQVRTEKAQSSNNNLADKGALSHLRSQVELEHKFKLAQELIGGGNLLEKTAVEAKLFDIAQRLKSQMLPPDPQLQKSAEAARKELFKLMKFVKELNPLTHQMLVGEYAKKQKGLIRQAVKHGAMELPAETLRFISAIVLVRIHNCFGNGINLLKWEEQASYKDPACVFEIWQMLKSPIFYAGFTAFVLASRATQATLTHLTKLDQALGAKGMYQPSSIKASLISNVSLAAGFFADHIVQTIANNKDLHKCVSQGDIVNTVIASSEKGKELNGLLIGETELGERIYAFKERIKNPHCGKFFNHLSSHEFLAEHTAVPLTSLILSAGALTAVTTGLTASIQGASKQTTAVATSTRDAAIKRSNRPQKVKILKALRMGERLKKFAMGIVFVPGYGLVPGVVLGVGRLVVFFKLNELIEPVIKSGYYSTYLRVLNNSYHAELRDGQQEYLKNWYEIKSQWLSKESDKQNGASLLLAEEKCSQHYSGKANDSVQACSRVPLLSDIATFRDYSTSWRQKKILGHFFEGYGRWKTKMDDSIYHYTTTLFQMRIMSISREMKYSSDGSVDYYDRFFTQLDKSIAKAALVASDGQPDDYEPLDEISALYEEYKAIDFNEQKKRQKILTSLPKEEFQLFKLIQAKDFLQAEFDELTNGNIYHNVADTDEDIDRLKNMAIKLLSGNIELHTINYDMLGRPYEVYELLDHLGLAFRLKTKDSMSPGSLSFSLKNIVLTMIQDEDPDVSGQGMYLLKNFLHRLIPTEEKGKSYVHPDVAQLTPSQINLRNRLHIRLSQMDPNYRYEYIYGSLIGKKNGQKATETVRWSKTQGSFSTKNIVNYTMSQLLCKQESTAADWLGNEGTPHVFSYPHIGTEENYCKNFLIPIHSPQGRKNKFSLNSSFFITEKGIHQGLFQVYLNLPEGPGVYNTEKETRQWWIKSYEPKAMKDLIKFEAKYQKLIKKEFIPKIGNTSRAGKILGVNNDNMVMRMIKQRSFWGLFSTQSLEYSAGEDLAESLAAELKEYQQIIRKAGGPLMDIPAWIGQKNLEFSKCFVNLLNSLQSKNYKPLKKQCEKSLNELKNKALMGNGLTKQDFLEMSRKTEIELTKEEIARLILRQSFSMIDKIISEVESYRKMITGELNFNLKKMDKKDCFEHNLNNFHLKEMLTEKDDEDTGSCFKPTTNN